MGVDTSEFSEYAAGEAMWETWPPGYGPTRRGKRENGHWILEGVGEKGGHGIRISGTKRWEWTFGFLVSQGSFASGFLRPCGRKRGKGETCPDINFGGRGCAGEGQPIWPKSQWVYCTMTKEKVDFLLRSTIVDLFPSFSSVSWPLRFSLSWMF